MNLSHKDTAFRLGNAFVVALVCWPHYKILQRQWERSFGSTRGVSDHTHGLFYHYMFIICCIEPKVSSFTVTRWVWLFNVYLYRNNLHAGSGKLESYSSCWALSLNMYSSIQYEQCRWCMNNTGQNVANHEPECEFVMILWNLVAGLTAHQSNPSNRWEESALQSLKTTFPRAHH